MSESDDILWVLKNSSSPQARFRPDQSVGPLENIPSYDVSGSIEHFTCMQLPMANLMSIRYHKWLSHRDRYPLCTGPAASYLWGTPRTIARVGDFSKYNPGRAGSSIMGLTLFAERYLQHRSLCYPKI